MDIRVTVTIHSWEEYYHIILLSYRNGSQGTDMGSVMGKATGANPKSRNSSSVMSCFIFHLLSVRVKSPEVTEAVAGVQSEWVEDKKWCS